MIDTRFAVAAALLCPFAAAQSGGWTSSPSGYEYVEGGTNSSDFLAAAPTLRYQQIDSTSEALPNRSRLAFRRDGHLADNPLFVSRKLEIELVMAESDLANLSTTFASNYAGAPTTVVARKKIDLPDWTRRPAFPPAPPDAVLLFDQSWSYGGKQATGKDLLWELRVYGNDQVGKPYPFDFQYVVPNVVFGQLTATRSGHIDLGTGCQVARGESHMNVDWSNHGTKFTFDSHLHSVPNAPVFYTIGFYDANMTVSGLCAKIHVLPGITFPAGRADMIGDLDVDIDPLPYHPQLVGVDLYVQAVAPDASKPGIPLALSSAAKFTVPPDPLPPAVGRIWAFDHSATVASFGPEPGGVIVQTGE